MIERIIANRDIILTNPLDSSVLEQIFLLHLFLGYGIHLYSFHQKDLLDYFLIVRLENVRFQLLHLNVGGM